VRISRIHWKSVLLIILALASFALTLGILGLFVSTLLMIFFASLAKKETRWGGIIIFSIILSVFTVIVFKIGFKLPLPVLPVFFR
jgi:Na+/melibiose symporter-like transporter